MGVDDGEQVEEDAGDGTGDDPRRSDTERSEGVERNPGRPDERVPHEVGARLGEPPKVGLPVRDGAVFSSHTAQIARALRARRGAAPGAAAASEVLFGAIEAFTPTAE